MDKQEKQPDFVIIGRTGSGKRSGSGEWTIRHMLKGTSSGLILAKPEREEEAQKPREKEGKP